MILITGSTGNTGREVLSLLRSSSYPVRAMTHRPEAREALSSEGIDAMLGDFDDPASLEAALLGVDKAFLVCTPDERLAEREITFIEAARKAGVQRIVKISALLSVPDSPSPNLRAHAAVEKALRESGMEYTALRPNGFMQTLVWMSLPMIQGQGMLAGPAGHGACAHIDLRDVAAVAHRALVEDDLIDQTLDLTGPKAVTMAEVAAVLGQAFGKPIQYVDLPPEQMSAGMRQMGVAESAVAHVEAIFKMIREGKMDFVSPTLTNLGIEPRTWEQCVKDLASGGTKAATSFSEPPAGG